MLLAGTATLTPAGNGTSEPASGSEPLSVEPNEMFEIPGVPELVRASWLQTALLGSTDEITSLPPDRYAIPPRETGVATPGTMTVVNELVPGDTYCPI